MSDAGPAPTSQAQATPTDTAALINRVSVALARSQRLMDSWLPAPPTSSASDFHALGTNTTTASRHQDDESSEAPLAERPERFGVGATLPSSEAGLRLGRSDAGAGLAGLRKQLGIKPARGGAGGSVAKHRNGTGPRGRGPVPDGKAKITGAGASSKETAEDIIDEGEEESRTTAVGRKGKGDGVGQEGEEGKGGAGRKRKRGAAYLDEILGARRRKAGK